MVMGIEKSKKATEDVDSLRLRLMEAKEPEKEVGKVSANAPKAKFESPLLSVHGS